MIIDAAPRHLRDKIAKIALDLVKLENENFSLAALKLLISCTYTGKVFCEYLFSLLQFVYFAFLFLQVP